jgi:prepilin-type N-terminal cleavage/methylation domain-containing protein
MNWARRDEKGFTLIEIMIAIGIFAFGILAVATLQIHSIKGNTQANNVTLLGSLASGCVETLKSLPFDNPLLEAGIHPAQPRGDYWIGWSVQDDVPLSPRTLDTDGNPMDPLTLCKTIELVVFSSNEGFEDGTGENRLFSFQLIKTRYL